jgi:hypothetical protein
MKTVSCAVEKGETQGLTKIAVDAETKQVLDAGIYPGLAGSDMQKVSYTLIQRVGHIHSTFAEFIPTVLSKLRQLTEG